MQQQQQLQQQQLEPIAAVAAGTAVLLVPSTSPFGGGKAHLNLPDDSASHRDTVSPDPDPEEVVSLRLRTWVTPTI